MAITINKMSWTRVFLEVGYHGDPGADLMLFNFLENRYVPFSYERNMVNGEEHVIARLNIVNAMDRKPLPEGEWVLCLKVPESVMADEERLFAEYPYFDRRVREYIRRHLPKEYQSDEGFLDFETRKKRMEVIKGQAQDTHSLSYTDDVLLALDNLCKVYRYEQGEFVYTASFLSRSDASSYPYVALVTGFFKHNPRPKDYGRDLRYQGLGALSGVVKARSILPKRTGAVTKPADGRKRVLFLKENGPAPTANMAAVINRIKERGLDKQFDVVERYRNCFETTDAQADEWIHDMELVNSSDFVFIDDFCPLFGYVTPPKTATIVQLWHAGVGFKSVGYARFGISGSPHPYHSSHRTYTYAVVGNEHLRKVYSEVFGIEEEAFLATGMPRLDRYREETWAQNAKARLYRDYPWMEQGRVIVFAPTFRGAGQRTAFYPYEDYLDLKALYEMCVATDSYFVFKMHQFVSDLPKIPQEYQDRIIDLSNEILDEMYCVADVLVTDYSSCFYDYLLFGKPVVFYVPDKVSYAITRGVQRTVDEMGPGAICNTFDEFVTTLANGDYAHVDPDPSCLDRALEGGMLACDRIIDTVLLGKDVPGVKLVK